MNEIIERHHLLPFNQVYVIQQLKKTFKTLSALGKPSNNPSS